MLFLKKTNRKTEIAEFSYVINEKLSLLSHTELNEEWIQELIEEAPSILGPEVAVCE